MIHRAVFGRGPSQLLALFAAAVAAKRSSNRLRRHVRAREVLINNSHLEVLKRSAFGLLLVYKVLPEIPVLPFSVNHVQSGLHLCLKNKAVAGAPSWSKTFSPRLSWESHPVRHL